MRAARVVALTSLVLVVTGMAASFFVPVPPSFKYSDILFYAPLMLTVGLALATFGGATLLLMGAGAYTASLRRAYLVICLGILLGAVGALQLPIFNALSLWRTFYAASGLFALPFVLAGLAVYIGVRKISRLIGIQNWLTRPYVALPVILLVCCATVVLPHVYTTVDEVTYDASNIILGWSVFTFLAAVLMMRAVLARVGAHYRRAMAWLLLGLSSSFVSLFVAFFSGFVSSQNPDYWAVAAYTFGLAGGLLYVVAGLTFANTKDY